MIDMEMAVKLLVLVAIPILCGLVVEIVVAHQRAKRGPR